MSIIGIRTALGILFLALPCAFVLWKFYPHPKFKRIMQDFGVVIIFLSYVAVTAGLIQNRNPVEPRTVAVEPAPVVPKAEVKKPDEKLAKADTYDLTTIGNTK